MPIYRLNSSGYLKKISGVYRLNSSGALKKISQAFRLNSVGQFKRIFVSLITPTVKTANPPLLYFRDSNGNQTTSKAIEDATSANQVSPAAFNGDTVYLTRGRWNDEPITFNMKIQKDTSSSFTSPVLVNASSERTITYSSYSDGDENDQVPASSANRYTITKTDVRDGYYFRGHIEATNFINETGEFDTPFALPRMFVSAINFTQNLDNTYGTNIQTNGGTFTWSYSGGSIVAADVDTQDFFVYPYNNTSGSALYSTSIFPGTSTSSSPTSTVTFTNINLEADTQYTIVIRATMKDGWSSNSNTALRTIVSDEESFTTAADKPAKPVITSATDVGTNRPYGNGAVDLVWTQPSGGASVTGYKIEYSQGPDYITISPLVSDTGNSNTTGTFTGLSSSTNYKFYVTAIGSASNSDTSDPSSVVFITTVPTAPTGVSAIAGNAAADVYFTGSAQTGGKSIIDYRATSTPGSITASDTVSPIPVTGLTNFTAYTFTVAARNLNGYSLESAASASVTPTLPAPVGSGTVTIASNSASNYIYQITSYGTWSNSPTSYDYQWQTSSDGGSTWTTRASGTAVTSIPDYNASSYKAQNIRLRVWGRNQAGAAISPLVSNTLFILYTTPIINSFSVTGNVGSASWTYSYSTDDPSPTIQMEYKLSSSSTWISVSSPTSPGSISLSGGTYDFRLYVFNSANGGFRVASSTVSNITVTSAPSASSFSRSDSTTIPSTPSTISFSSSNNQVTSSWTNGSPITSVRFQGSGAGVSTNYLDSSSPFITSDLSNYSSSGTYTATVTNYNNNLQVTVSWNQANTQSYKIHYNSSVFGAETTPIYNDSSSSVSRQISWNSISGSFTFTGLTVYSGTNGTGTSTFYSTGLSAITPSEKTSQRTNSTSLTYTAPNLTAPSISSVSQSTPGGSLSVYFTGGSGPYYQIWWQSSSDYSGVTSYDASGSSSPVTDTTGPSAGTWYVAVRSVSSPGNTGSGPSSTISSWSTPVQFTVTATTYTVTWNANGGSVSPSSSSGTSGTVVYAPTPTRSGYTFDYWRNPLSGGDPIILYAGNSYTITGNITFYAIWTASASAPATPTGFSISGSGFASWNASTGATSYTLEYYLATNSAGASADGPFYYYPTGTSQQISYQTIGGVLHNYVRGRIRAENGQSSSYTAWYPTSTTYV